MTPQSPYRIHQLSTGINLFTPDLHLTDSKVSMIYSWLFRIWICLELPSRSSSGIVCTQSTGWQYVAEILCLFQGELWILFTEPVSPPEIHSDLRLSLCTLLSLLAASSFDLRRKSQHKQNTTKHPGTSCTNATSEDFLTHFRTLQWLLAEPANPHAPQTTRQFPFRILHNYTNQARNFKRRGWQNDATPWILQTFSASNARLASSLSTTIAAIDHSEVFLYCKCASWSLLHALHEHPGSLFNMKFCFHG